MGRTIPPLNPLHVFAVAAQFGNFTAAGEALGVTPSAVSRQIAVLESYLETRLFHRGASANTLTDTGRAYFEQIAPAFDMLSLATQAIRDSHGSTPLKIRVLATFGMRFLIPRLSDFRAQHPSIHLSIDTGFAPADFSRADIDISIQLGDGNWPGTQSKHLFDSTIQPVCGAQLAKAAGAVKKTSDLAKWPLLYSRNRPDDWAFWLRTRGESETLLARAEMVEFSNSLLMYQAAGEGVGVALGQLPILSSDVESGRLTPLLGPAVPQGAYYAVWRSGAGPNRKMRHFLSWLDRELITAFGAPASADSA
ncbi:MAG: transcriptional regulator, LysR family [Hyphomicrobiales bacterium]|nr:transcriptional regulator, LysR family [Hyphomicrobiales bacterium]